MIKNYKGMSLIEFASDIRDKALRANDRYHDCLKANQDDEACKALRKREFFQKLIRDMRLVLLEKK